MPAHCTCQHATLQMSALLYKATNCCFVLVEDWSSTPSVPRHSPTAGLLSTGLLMLVLVLVCCAGLVNPLLLAAVGSNVGVAWHARLASWDGITAMSVFFGQVSCGNTGQVAAILIAPSVCAGLPLFSYMTQSCMYYSAMHKHAFVHGKHQVSFWLIDAGCCLSCRHLTIVMLNCGCCRGWGRVTC